jgi:hypothetical protein
LTSGFCREQHARGLNVGPDERPLKEASGGPGAHEQRAAPRFTLLIRTAKLVIDGKREFLCIIRDASTTGVKVRTFTPLPENPGSMLVEMSNGDCYPVEMIWQEGEYAGLRFVDDVDLAGLLDESSGAYPKRQIRLRVHLDAMLHSGGTAVDVAFKDISQRGASIACDKWLLLNELVRIETGVLPAIYAKVRWRDHPHYGLLFEQTFQLDELARIVAPLQRDPGVSGDQDVPGGYKLPG